ncbi:MAG: thioesterase family protein [Planctomycetota bacterium]
MAPRRSAPTRAEPYVHEVLVRYAETDQMGVVHHANFLLYLEDARTVMLRDLGLPYGEVERSGVALPVREVRLQYKSPALYEDVLRVSLWVERVRAASVTFGYEIHRSVEGEAGAPLVSAQVELACMDLATRRPRVFPDELREIFGPRSHGKR